jgi:hypothetical protein
MAFSRATYPKKDTAAKMSIMLINPKTILYFVVIGRKSFTPVGNCHHENGFVIAK